MSNSTIRKGFAVSKDERAMVYQIASCFGYKSNGEVVRDLLKKWSKDKTFEGTLDEIEREKLTTITVIMTMNELNRLNRLCAQYGVPNGKLVRNLIHSFYSEHEQEIAEAERKQEEPAEQIPEPTAIEQVESESLFRTEEFVDSKNPYSFSRKRIDITDEEYEIARTFNFEIGDLIDREYKAVEAGKREIFDFCQEADSDNACGKKPATLQYKLTLDKQTELKLLCDFYGKGEPEVVRHVLYSANHGKYIEQKENEPLKTDEVSEETKEINGWFKVLNNDVAYRVAQVKLLEGIMNELQRMNSLIRG